MQCTYWDSSTAQNSFWTCLFWCLLVLLPFFLFGFPPLPHQQNVSLSGLFSSWKQSCSGQDQVNREGEAWGSCHFLVKNWTHTTVWADALINHPSWTGQRHWRNLKKKNSLKPNAASYNNASWHTNTAGFQNTHQRRPVYKRPTLQKVILVFLGSPIVHRMPTKNKDLINIWFNFFLNLWTYDVCPEKAHH